jgi:hypothetical protein
VELSARECRGMELPYCTFKDTVVHRDNLVKAMVKRNVTLRLQQATNCCQSPFLPIDTCMAFLQCLDTS